MKKKLIAVLLSLAMVSSAVPDSMIFASDSADQVSVEEIASVDDSAVPDDFGSEEEFPEEALTGADDQAGDDSSIMEDASGVEADGAYEIPAIDGQEDVLSDGAYYYRKISDTEVSVTGAVDEDTESLTIPSEFIDGDVSYMVTAVEKDAFSGLSAQSIYIPDTVKEFGAQRLPDLTGVTVSEENSVFTVCDGVLFKKTEDEEKSVLVLYPAAYEGESYVIPDNTGTIAEYAFADNKNLKILVISDGIEQIESEAVTNAQNSLEIAFAYFKTPEEVAENAFVLDGADGNILYLRSDEALQELRQAEESFVYSPAMYDEEGSLVEDYSEAVKFETDGIPEHIQKLIDSNAKLDKDTDAALSDESEADAARKDDKNKKEDIVGDNPESLDAKISSGFYSMKNQAIARYFKIRNAGIKDSTDSYLAAYGSDMGATLNIVPVGNGLYKIIAACSNKALTLGGAPNANTAVIQKPYTGDANQLWYIRETAEGSGVYRFYSSENDSYVMDTKDKGTASATPIVLAKVSSSKTQQWSLISRKDPTQDRLANGIYKISSALASSRVLDIDGGSKNNGANVQIYSSNNSEAQQFILRYLGYSNLYRVVNVNSNKALDTTGSKTADKTNVQQSTQNNSSTTQIWRIVKNSDGNYAIFNAGANRVLEIKGGQTANGTNVWINKWSNSKPQKWSLTPVSGKSAVDVSGKDAAVAKGWYKLTSARVDRSIAVRNASLDDGANVIIQAPRMGENSYFYIEPVGNEKYEIRAFCSNKVLTNVWGADSVDAGNVVQKTDSDISTQRWYIRVSKKNNKYVSIVSSSDQNYVLSLKENKPGFGTSVTTALSTGLNGQRWRFTKVDNPVLSDPYNNTTYKIETTTNSKLVVSTEAQSKKNQANVQLMTKVNGAGEFWDFHKAGYGNLYTITNSYTGLALDAKNAGTADGTNVWQYTANNSNAQLWRVMPTDSTKKKFVIINAASYKALDLNGGSKTAGTNVQIYSQNGTDAQQWALSRANINTYIPVNTGVTIRMKGDKTRLIEVKNGSTDNGAAVQMYTESGNTDQIFIFKKQSDGSYKIQNVASNKFLGVSNNNVVSTANNNSDNQCWLIQPTGDNDASFKIFNKKTGLALTGAYAKNTGVVQSSYTNVKAQKFYFDTPNIKTGWQQVGSNWRYYDSKGNCYRDTFMENGKYYFDKNGDLLTGWKKYNGYYYYFKGKNGREETDNRPYVMNLYSQVGGKNYSQYSRPNCPYRFTIDVARCVVTWYTKYPGTNDYNVPVVAFLCSPGTTSSPTDVGNRRIGYTRHYIPLMGPSYGQYGSEILMWTYPAGGGPVQWTNNGEYFHSVACGAPNDHNLNPNTYNLLGTRQSHGCVRLGVRNAYWIWNFVDAGTEGRCDFNMAAPLRTLPQPWAINTIDPTDPGRTGNWGYVDNYATANTNGAFIPRG